MAIGPGGVGTEQLYSTNRRYFAETATPWVRLWADWPRLQPGRGVAPDMRVIDEQVAGARADGLKVMLTAWRFPRWANGTDALTAASEPTYRLEDRVAPGEDPRRRKDLTFQLARDLSPRSDWGRWIDFLIARYGGGAIDALEILNEPNLQLWPQRGVAGAVAEMMETAQRIAARHGERAPLLVAPATADPVGDSVLRTGYDTFTRELLDRLDERGFRPGRGFAWSHHSYADVEADLGGADNRVADVRRMLTGRWAGWPDGDAANPTLLITETGARLDKVAEQAGLTDAVAARARQAELLERNWWRMQLGPEGEGVALLCLYPFVTDIHYDSGLCDLDGTPRPAYHAWARLAGGR
jgi:hypothetical protein